ncbi:hypothetical protein T492DRAFT_848264 [Pavlovales sp. CCMP2436]|nr:hypothetical protein T492DRAFT_848264 [Pavlovales sp. CCMP2436]|mmetsp:Transcript_18127/g.46416  ORF Transcript_18127/g.46416 Transcript_18127/m.46416 type:complete len:217 (-) Transcript_18127:218-868(-)
MAASTGPGKVRLHLARADFGACSDAEADITQILLASDDYASAIVTTVDEGADVAICRSAIADLRHSLGQEFTLEATARYDSSWYGKIAPRLSGSDRYAHLARDTQLGPYAPLTAADGGPLPAVNGGPPPEAGGVASMGGGMDPGQVGGGMGSEYCCLVPMTPMAPAVAAQTSAEPSGDSEELDGCPKHFLRQPSVQPMDSCGFEITGDSGVNPNRD